MIDALINFYSVIAIWAAFSRTLECLEERDTILNWLGAMLIVALWPLAVPGRLYQAWRKGRGE